MCIISCNNFLRPVVCCSPGEGTLQLRDQELSRELREDRKKSVRFADFEKKPLDIRFQVPDSDETTSVVCFCTIWYRKKCNSMA